MSSCRRNTLLHTVRNKTSNKTARAKKGGFFTQLS
jgi:hypothetical protein